VPRELTILERIRRGEPDRPTATESVTDRIRSVTANISRILNAREGHAPAQPEYGMPAPSEIVHAFPHAVDRCKRQIQDQLDRYEPRLSDLEVIHLEVETDPLKIYFQLSGKLRTDAGGTWLTLRVVYHPSGRVDIRR